MDRKTLLSNSWSIIAAEYNRHLWILFTLSGNNPSCKTPSDVLHPKHRILVPRFRPWIQQSIQHLLTHPLPSHGEIVVPACGPGAELLDLHAAFPQRTIVGIDLAPGMVTEAQRTVTGCHNVRVLVGDACSLPALSPIAAILSTFGLQQMPSPAKVLKHWVDALTPGGMCVVCYWPPTVEENGPWQLLSILSNLPPAHVGVEEGGVWITYAAVHVHYHAARCNTQSKTVGAGY